MEDIFVIIQKILLIILLTIQIIFILYLFYINHKQDKEQKQFWAHIDKDVQKIRNEYQEYLDKYEDEENGKRN